MKWLWVLLVAVLLMALGIVFVAREVPAPVVALPPDATAVLEDPRFAAPPDWQWRRTQTQAGEVRWGHSAPAAPKAVVYFLPGYSAPLEIYLETFTLLNVAGYAVVAIDWPGQGGSERGSENPQKIHATSLDGHVLAAADVLVEARALYPGKPTLLVGLSMGAQLGTRLLAAAQSFGAAALITPAFDLADGRPSAIELTLLRVLDGVGFGERYAPGGTDWTFDMQAHEGTASACSHPNDRTKLFYASMARDASIKVGGMSNAFALAMIDSAQDSRSPAVLDKIDVPVWMPVAENDFFVDNAAAAAACDRLADCRLQQYDEARHCLFEESDEYYEPFIADLIRFLDEQVVGTTL